VRTRKRALARVIELTAGVAQGRTIERLAIVHVCAEDEARAFEADLRASIPCPAESIMAPLSAGLAVHSGAGLVGAAVVVVE